MISTKYLLRTRLFLILSILLNCLTVFSDTIGADSIMVTDFKFYRKIVYKDQQILIHKNMINKSIYYLSDNYQIDYEKRNNEIIENFKTSSKNTNFKINYFKNRVTLFERDKSIYFENSAGSACNKTAADLAIALPSRQMIRAIDNTKVAALVDNSCTESQKEKLGSYFANILTNENSWLSLCFNNKAVDRMIEADPNFSNYIGSVYSRYLRVVQKINEGKTSVEISCKVPNSLSSTVNASYEDSLNREKFSFNMNKIESQIDVTNDSAASNKFNELISHELFHLGEKTQTPFDRDDGKCINESYARAFTSVCATSNKVDELNTNGKESAISIPTSEQIALACKTEGKIPIVSLKSSPDLSDVKYASLHAGVNGTGITPTQSNEAQIRQQQNMAVQKNLNKTVADGDFNRVSDDSFAILASTSRAGTTQGKPYPVSAKSPLGETAIRAVRSFEISGKKIAGKLSDAMGIVTSTAQANVGNNATASSSSSSNYVPVTKSQPEDLPPSILNSRMPATIINTPTSSNGKTKPTSELDAGTTSNGKQNSANTTLNAKLSIIQNENSTKSSAGSISTGNDRFIANSSALRKSTEQNQAEGAQIMEAVKFLKAYTEIKGGADSANKNGTYEKIKEKYTNRNFQNVLQLNGIGIRYKNTDGKSIVIGDVSESAKRVFVERDQTLKLINNRKQNKKGP